MSTQQDIYVAGSKNYPPMLNKDNYVQWSCRIIRYARSRPNGKIIVDSIENGPYVRRMIATPGEPDLHVPVPESFHEQTDKELTENEIKWMDTDDQAIQTILLGLPEDVYAATDNCLDIEEQEMKEKLFNEWEKFTSTDGESIESYYHRFMQLMDDLKRNKHFPENIAANLKIDKFRMLEKMMGISLDSMLDKWHIISKGTMHGGIQVAQNAGLRVLEMGIKPEEFDFMAAVGDLDEIEEVNGNCILMANLQHASISSTLHDKAPVYDTDGLSDVQLNDNYYDNEIFNMFTQEDQYTDLLEPILEPQLVPQNDNHVTSVVPSMVQSGGTVETSFAPNEETRVFVPQMTKSKEELFLSNVSNMVIVSKMISIPNEDLLDDTTPSVARKFLNEVKNSLVTLQRAIKQKMTLEVHNWSSSAHKEVHKIISHEIAPIINQVDARVQNFKIQFLQEAAKFVRDFKSLAKEADESLDKQKSLELLDRTKEKLELCIIKKEKEYDVLWNNWYTKCEECKYDKISYDKAYNDMQQKLEQLQAQLRDLNGKSSDTPSASNTLDPLNQKLETKIVELEFQVVNYEREISYLNTTYKNLFDSITSNRAHAKLHDLIYENAKLRARLFENTSGSMNNTLGVSVTPQVDKPKLIVVIPYSKKLYASIPSHFVPQPREFHVVKHSKRHATFKENVSSDTVNASSTGLVHNARTKKPQPKGNIRNARVPSASKRSEVKKNDKFEILCGTCKQCLVTANHDACLLSSVNALNSRAINLYANVPFSANQKRHRTHVWKPKQVGFKERLACTPKPRFSLKWSPSRHNFDLKGKLVASKETNCPNDDKDCPSKPQEPIRKRFPNSIVFLGSQNWRDLPKDTLIDRLEVL
nr:hypothetical protein [Tanacetum cinerariifolium]